ncbi:PHP domain-containing protein [Nocardia nova]
MTIVADLHTHTWITDGRLAPQEVIARAGAARLKALAITDHSVVTYSGLADVATRHGIELAFPAVEVSTFHGERKYHITLYGSAILDPQFAQYIRKPLNYKNLLIERVCDELRCRGIEVGALNAVAKRGNGPDAPATPGKLQIGRTTLAKHVAAKTNIDPDEALRLVVRIHDRLEREDRARPGSLSRRYIPTLQLLDRAARIGATASLAHPLWECADEAGVRDVCADIATFHAAGLRGIETESYHHRRWDNHPFLHDVRTRLGLLRVGGSDFHGNGRTEIGRGGMTADEYAQFAALVRTDVAVTR